MEYKTSLKFDGRPIEIKWIETKALPANIAVSQVAGFCFDGQKRVAIIKNEHGWGFPGGHPEKGESNEETLQREVAEEACLSVKNPELIGYVEVKDPENNSVEGKHYLQLRYLAEADKINDFKKEFESSERMFVPVEELPKFISWLSSPTGAGQMETLKKHLKR